ncbi:MAG: DUF3472 domain-containing protein [Prevotellaceae bacterium]|nr:DUF3472 domain-containing protein [Candidatus Faecinaster equi]
MKKFCISICLLSLVICGISQRYNSTKDFVYACRYYSNIDGVPQAVGNRSGTSPITSWANNNTVYVYGIKLPAGYVKGNLMITPKYGKKPKIRLRIVDSEKDVAIHDTTITIPSTGSSTVEVAVEVMPDMFIPEDGWYLFELSCENGTTAIQRFRGFEFQRESNNPVATSDIFMAPSTHLFSWDTTDPLAPGGESYDWAYMEAMYPSKYEYNATYIMTLGVLSGYMGFQSGTNNRSILFSMWDNGDTDKDKYLPSHMRSGGLDNSPNITVGRFGNEGTGVQSYENGQLWKPDHWVQWICNARPERVNVKIKRPDGTDSTIVYENTLVSTWMKNDCDDNWYYMATLREAGRNHLISGWYSFIENFVDFGGDRFRRAYFRNGFTHSVASGKWINRNYCGYGHTQGDENTWNSRFDYGHGATEMFDNCFYLETGGYHTHVNDSSMFVPLATNTTCVDTINLERLTKRIDQAVRKGKYVEIKADIENCCDIYDQTNWTVIDFSDQETSGEGDFGRAAQTMDGSETSYWHTAYRSSSSRFPHYLSFMADKVVTLRNISLYQERASGYRAKTINLYTSVDGKMWTKVVSNFEVEDTNRPFITLPENITSQYFKLEFVAGYGTNLVINEIVPKGEITLEKTRNYAKSMLDKADQLGGYASPDLVNLKNVFENTNSTIEDLQQAMLSITTNAMPLKFSRPANLSNINSSHTYIFENYYGKGIVGATNIDGVDQLTLTGATATDATEKNKTRTSVVNPDNQWIIIRADEYGKKFIYNLGKGKFLDLNAPSFLSDTPAEIIVALTSGKFGITIKSKYLCADCSSDSEPVKYVKTLSDRGAQFNIFDNNYKRISQETLDSLLAVVDDYCKFNSYVQKMKQIIGAKEGQVGYLPNESERNIMIKLYDEGNASFENRLAIFDAVDNANIIKFEPEKYVYKILAEAPPTAGNEYLTMNETTVKLAANDNKTDQIWTFKIPGKTNFSLISQNQSIATMPNYSSKGISITSLAKAGIYAPYQNEIGKFSIGAVINCPIVLGNVSPIKTTDYKTPSSYWRMERVDSISISLNSAGMYGLYYSFDVVIPESLKVYVVSKVSPEGVATLKRIKDFVPAGTAAIIVGDVSQKVKLAIRAPQGGVINDNLLLGTCYKKIVTKKTFYTLSTSSGKGIMKQGIIGQIPANSVYVKYPDDAIPSFSTITFEFDDDPTAIKEISTSAKHQIKKEGRYNLQGVPVNENEEGIIIINRKKLNAE